jgi:hypothetical protein
MQGLASSWWCCDQPALPWHGASPMFALAHWSLFLPKLQGWKLMRPHVKVPCRATRSRPKKSPHQPVKEGLQPLAIACQGRLKFLNPREFLCIVVYKGFLHTHSQWKWIKNKGRLAPRASPKGSLDCLLKLRQHLEVWCLALQCA